MGDLTVEVERFPFPNSAPISIPVHIDLLGLTYGGGSTVAIGNERYFASLDVNYTRTDFDKLANTLSVLVVAPRIGMIVENGWFNGEVHVGTMFQEVTQTIEVELDQPGLGSLEVSVDQVEPNAWNGLIGTLWAIDERLHAIVEVGAGGRSYIIGGLTLRF